MPMVVIIKLHLTKTKILKIWPIHTDRSSGQSLIMQFILFFLIGLGLFIGLGNFFRMESENLRENLIGLSLEMIGSYVSSMTVSSVEGCTNCGTVENIFKLGKSYAGYFIEVGLNNTGLSIVTKPSKAEYYSSLNNLNESLNIVESSSISVKTINLTYNRNQNKLEIT